MSSDHGPRLRAQLEGLVRTLRTAAKARVIAAQSLAWDRATHHLTVAETEEFIAEELDALLRASASALPEHDKWCISRTTQLPCDCEIAPHRVASSSSPPAIEDVVGSVDFGDTTVKEILDDLRGKSDTEQP